MVLSNTDLPRPTWLNRDRPPVDVNTQLGGGAAAVGPYLASHLGLPIWLVILYVIVILSACYSVIDSGDDRGKNIGTFPQADCLTAKRTFASFEPQRGLIATTANRLITIAQELFECCSDSLAMPRMSLMA